jgi:carbon monoxide dehydrogenase subunit G
LLDIKRIAGCIPGAELTEVVDERTYKGKVAVRLGPVALSLVGQANFESVDHDQHVARVKARGSDPKGRGGTDSVIDFRLQPDGAGTRVLIHTNIKLSGSVAQYGRGSGVIQTFASELIEQFGASLKAQLLADRPAANGAAARGAPAPAKPISGLRLMARVLWTSILRFCEKIIRR